jgi:hypothetical protein
MKVAELISRLQTFDPEMLVVISGYEEGLSPAFSVAKAAIRQHPSWSGPEDWIYGQFEEADEGGSVEAVAICLPSGGFEYGEWYSVHGIPVAPSSEGGA